MNNNIIRKLLSLAMIFVLNITYLTYAYASSGGSSGGGGGSATIVIPIMKDYTVTGTVYLPDGQAAPAGGIDVFCTFGGVSFDKTSSPAESFSEGGAFFYTGTAAADYILAAVIPEGQNSVQYEHSFKIAESYSAFYGKFSVYDNKGINVSNQIVLSTIGIIKSNKTDYSNIDVYLEEKTAEINGTVNLPENLLLSDNLEVLISAKNDYEEFQTKVNILSGSNSANYTLNVISNSEYTLSYSVVESFKSGLQPIKTGQ